MPKLIDAEAAKAAIEKLIEATQATRRLALEAGFREAALGAGYCYGALKEVLSDLDALPDASEGRWEKLRGHAKGYRVVAVAVENQEYIKAIDHILDSMEKIQGAAQPKTIHAERIPVPPHLAEAQRVVIRNALAAQPQEGE